jgi:hypothetical protein
VLAPTAAFAADYPDGNTPNTPTDPGTTQVKASTSSNSSTLPFTGGDVAGLVVVGAGAAVVGGAMVRHSRRARVNA